MQSQKLSDPVSIIIKACHKSESDAKHIYHQLAEEHNHDFKLASGTTLHLSDEQIAEFARRYSSEVEPTYWQSKRLKH